jgi:diguanylate cyclase (GGDEF)-like protein
VPNAASDKPRTFLRAIQALSVLGLAAYALHVSAGLGGDGLDSFFGDYLYNALILVAAASCVLRAARVREQRVAWSALGLALVSWSAAEIYNSFHLANLDDPPYPSLSDALYIAFYPIVYFALVMLVRSRLRELRASLWLDGLVAALAVCAIGEITVFAPMAEASLEGGVAPKEVATDLAYPVGDMLMLSLVVGVFALTAWRPGRAWTMIGLGLTAMAVADSVYAYQSSQGTYSQGGLLDAMWPAATLLVGFAAWEPSRTREDIDLGGWRMLVLPAAFSLPSLGVLVLDHWHPVDTAAIVLAALCMLAVIVRTAMTFGENLRMLERSRAEAHTDSLTGLGNRRRLLVDLRDRIELAASGEPHVLALFDIDGFKRYNDHFGHPAGDALLTRLGRALEASLSGRGHAYRLGGDEFCVLAAAGPEEADAMVAAATAALSEQGQGFYVTASHGMVLLPLEAGDPSAAMQVADERLYGQKLSRRADAMAASELPEPRWPDVTVGPGR